MGFIILLLRVREFGFGPWELSGTVSKEHDYLAGAVIIPPEH